MAYKGTKVTEAQLRRVCRMHFKDISAAKALGIDRSYFATLCAKLNIEKPSERKKRLSEDLFEK
jgi:hypothetical protein